jgi:tRNA nucleotidyltransferase (CCA-adding enzyme)
MQVYLVGGAVRDELLNVPVRERDWVVVGATPTELLDLGYRAVGREFPVFLHPQTQEEYALARLERKVAPGYRGFITEFSPEVTLEEDLRRRDLTINAMARASDGTLVDPYGGQADLAARLLRHVSPAFTEDPVRILRVARFAARFATLGFSVAPDTQALMRHMVSTGEAGALVSERVWRELERALGEAQPARFFEVLANCGALPVLLPELTAALATAADTDGGSPPLAALTAAAAAGAPGPVRWAVLLAGLEARAIEALCARLRAPNEYRELALLATRLDALLADGAPTDRDAVRDAPWQLSLYELADAFRRPERFEHWLQLLALGATAAGAATDGHAVVTASALAARLRAGLQRAVAVRLDPAELRQLKGPELGARLRELRLAALAALPR